MARMLRLGDELPARAESTPDGHGGRWWVFFADKGSAGPSWGPGAIQGAETPISARSKQRRLLTTGSLALDERDVPVNSEYLRAVAATGARIKGRSRWLNAASVYATREQLARIAGLPFVERIRPVFTFTRQRPEPVSMSPDQARGHDVTADPGYYNRTYDQLQQINVPAVHDLGYTGEGVIICMLDTGYNLAHEAFLELDVIAERDFVQGDSVTSNQPGDDPSQHNHGTLTMSTIGGYRPGEFVGGAPDAQFALAKTEIIDQEIQIEEDNYVMGLEWADSLGARIVSSSLGYFDWYTYEDMDGETAVTTIAVDIAASKGMTVVTAMGNERASAWHYLIAPADADSAIAVGAVDSDGILTSFSSVGPTYDGRIKPDVVARGQSTSAASPWDSTGYVLASGTSLSTPLIAATAALLAQAHPDWGPIEIRTALRFSADQAFEPDTLRGWGLPDALAALGTTVAGAPSPEPGYAGTVSPSPFRTSATIHFRVAGDAGVRSPVEVSVYDAMGRHVRTLFKGLLPGGPHSLEWDGRYGSGREAPSGIYMFGVKQRRGETGYKALLVR